MVGDSQLPEVVDELPPYIHHFNDVWAWRDVRVTEIANYCGVTESTIWRMNRKEGVRPRTRRLALEFVGITEAQYNALKPCIRSREFKGQGKEP